MRITDQPAPESTLDDVMRGITELIQKANRNREDLLALRKYINRRFDDLYVDQERRLSQLLRPGQSPHD
jgi:hypothetical protein